MSKLDKINGWERIETDTRSNISDHGEAWIKINDPSEEIVIDQSDPDEPRDWKVIFPDNRQRYSRFKPTVQAIAGLYMRKGSF